MSHSLSFGYAKPDPNAKPDLAALGKWLVAICAIRFDLEQGQLVEDCYPPGALSLEEESDVAFSSFPDSMTSVHNRASLHDCLFFFKVRRRGTPPGPPPSPAPPHRRNHSSHDGVGALPRRRASEGDEPLGRSRRITEPSSASPSGARARDRAHLESVSAADVSTSGRPLEGSDRRGGSHSWGPGQGEAYSNAATSSLGSPSASQRVTNGGLGGSGHDIVGRRSLDISPGMSFGPKSPLHGRGGGGGREGEGSRRSGSVSPGQSPVSRGGGSGGASANGGASLGPGSGGPKYLYGFVFNRQRHDERLRRGGEQKSVVILTDRPYWSLFRPLVQIAGPHYFDVGSNALEQIALHVGRWPAPVHGTTMELPVGTTTLRAMLPPAHTLPPSNWVPLDDFTAAMAPAPHNKAVPQGIFYEADLFGMYKGVLMQLWVLWEMLLVGEPLLVIAPSPSQCSEAVAALVGLTAPLPCSMDFRPYFTIHDPDFPALNSLKEGDQVPSMVLGVTNLFFLKALKNLPHVVSVGTPNPAAGAGGGLRAAAGGGLLRPNSQVPAKAPPAVLQLQQSAMSPLRRFSPSNLLSRMARVRREGPLSLMGEHREAVWTNYQPATKPDTTVLNRLVDGPAGSLPSAASETLTMINNEMLRRHFVELTTNFLAPFGPYLRASAPPQGASPFGDPPPLPSFDAHEFLEQMAARGPGKFLAKRLHPGGWLELYRRFLEGPNFMPWFQRRRAVSEAEQHRLWRKARACADVKTFLQSMTEAEIVDAFAAVEKHICLELQVAAQRQGGSLLSEPSVVQKLRGDLRAIYNALPREVQQRLLFTPQHAALLQGAKEPARLPGRPSLSSARDGGPLALSDSPRRVRANGLFGLGEGSANGVGPGNGAGAGAGSGTRMPSPLANVREAPRGFPGNLGIERALFKDPSDEDLCGLDEDAGEGKGEGEGEGEGEGRGGQGREGDLLVESAARSLAVRSASTSTLMRFRTTSPRVSESARSLSASAESTPRHKEGSGSTTPSSYSTPRFWEWSPVGSSQSTPRARESPRQGGSMSYFSSRVRGSDSRQTSPGPTQHNSLPRESHGEIAGRGLDPNPFNPLY